MADREIDQAAMPEVPNMPNELNHVLVYALNYGRDLVNDGKMIIPFTVLLIGGKPFVRHHEGASTTECYKMAQHEVEGARGAQAYALCYDGYLDTPDGPMDCIIAEGGVPGADTGYAIGYLYSLGDDRKPKIATTASFIGKAPNFMKDLVGEPEAPVDTDAWADEALAAEQGSNGKINTVEDGEILEANVEENFGEPVKDAKIETINNGEILEEDNAKNFGEPLKGEQATTIKNGETLEDDNANEFGEPVK